MARSTGNRSGGRCREIAGRFEDVANDAAYLELAIRRGLPLATIDGKLRTAAKAVGVALLEVS